MLVGQSSMTLQTLEELMAEAAEIADKARAELLREKQVKSIEQEARETIYGDRERTYGHPAKNLEHIAELWSAYTRTTITADQVCDMMILLKLARLKNDPTHRDSLIDMIGYTLLKERIHEHD